MCVCTPGDFHFKWVKVRLASYYCLHSHSYIITVSCNMDGEGERDRNGGWEEGGQKERDADREIQKEIYKRYIEREKEEVGKHRERAGR